MRASIDTHEFRDDGAANSKRPIQGVSIDDDRLALGIVDDWSDKVAFLHNEWHVYENGVWTARAIQEVKRNIRKFLRGYRVAGVKVNQRQINSLVQMLEDDLYKPDRELIQSGHEARNYINLRNGLFNLETLQLESHRPELHMTTQLDFEYDPEADCPTFRRYLRSSLVKPDSAKPDEDLIFLVLEGLAYSMTARTDMKASFWLVGEPDSGKSTLVSIIRKLMGNLHATIDLNQLATNRFLLSGIVGKRVVTFTEAQSNVVLPDALYKAMVGGTDEIYVDVKNRPGIAFVPEAKFWWAMNEPPRISDRTGATFNRLKVIPFNRSIPRNQRIMGLDELVMREAPGVFNWIFTVGWQRLLNGGEFTRPAQSVGVLERFQLDNDTEASFLDDCAIREESSRVQSQALYDAYRSWCERFGFRPKNVTQVAKDWRRLGLQYIKDNNSFWIGISLKD